MIKRGILFLFCWLMMGQVFAQKDELKFIRSNYALAIENKALCLSIMRELQKTNDNPIMQAYLGAYQAIWANHVVNPFQKLKAFKQGRKQIDASIKKHPNLIELRFIRLSIQKHAPSFLGYRNEIEEDIHFLKKNKQLVSSPELKAYIEELLR